MIVAPIMTQDRKPESYSARLAREHRERRARFFVAPARVDHAPKPAEATTEAVMAAELGPKAPYGIPVMVITKPIEEAERLAAVAVVPMISRIQRACAQEFDFSVTDLKSDRRTANVVLARQVAMYLAKTITLKSYPEIGRRFGGKDHTTVLHAYRKIEARIERDADLAARVAAIKDRVTNVPAPTVVDAGEAPVAPINAASAAGKTAQ